MPQLARTRRRGIWLAAATALISGFAIFFNGYGVRAWSDIADPAAYTTVKNLFAAVLIGIAATLLHMRRSTDRPRMPSSGRDRLALLVIAIIGGSVPFVLFFEGLAAAASAQAAALHKTLLIWVALLALLFLKERIGWPHIAAIGLLVWGQVALIGTSSIAFGRGELMILIATVLWSVEVVIAKRVMANTTSSTVALARMGGGSIVLIAWAIIQGGGIDWSGLTTSHLVWVLVAGMSLSGYVLTWFAALSRAPAVDVTAVLVGGALITAILQTAVRGAALPDPLGVTLIAVGVVVILALGRQGRGVASS